MYVAIFTDTFDPDPNGVAIAVARQRDTLLRAGYSVDVVGPAMRRVPTPISAIRLFTTPNENYSLYLPTQIPQFREDGRGRFVVHCHTPFSFGALGLSVAKRRKAIAVYTHHTNFFPEYLHYLGKFNTAITTSILRLLYLKFLSKFDIIITPSLAARTILLNEFDVDREKTIILPTPVTSHPSASPTWCAARDIDVIYVSRLAPEKNVELAMQTILTLHSEEPNVKTGIVGEGVFREKLISALTSNIGASITYYGRMSNTEVHTLMRRSKVLLFTSLSDTQGLVIDEALINGAKVVAVECPLTIERLGQNGAVRLARSTPEALVRALRCAISHASDCVATTSNLATEHRNAELESAWLSEYFSVVRRAYERVQYFSAR